MVTPNFLVIGTAKAGTTSLWYYLRQHPQIFLPWKKECHYFCNQEMGYVDDWDDRHKPVGSREDYLALFDEEGDFKAAGEVSPLYLYHGQAAARIKEEMPEAKLIALLRNPAERAFSAWMHMRRDGKEELSFEDALDAEESRRESSEFHPGFYYRELGFYAQRLERYQGLFSPSQIMLVRYEEFQKENSRILKSICEFLDVDSDFQFPTQVKLNISGIPKRPWLHNWLLEGLPKSRVCNLIKKPFTEQAWMRMVKGVQHWNLERPKLSDSTRQKMLEDYSQDMERLQDEWGFDASAWRNPA